MSEDHENQTVCTTCNGHGWLPNEDMDLSDPEAPDGFTCEDCGGDGWLDNA